MVRFSAFKGGCKLDLASFCWEEPSDGRGGSEVEVADSTRKEERGRGMVDGGDEGSEGRCTRLVGEGAEVI